MWEAALRAEHDSDLFITARRGEEKVNRATKRVEPCDIKPQVGHSGLATVELLRIPRRRRKPRASTRTTLSTFATTRVASESRGKFRLIVSDHADMVKGSSLPTPNTATSSCPESAKSSVAVKPGGSGLCTEEPTCVLDWGAVLTYSKIDHVRR